ncbi:MAG: SBBP repeat-containing protein, partial [Bacteroidota bacterium]
EGLATDPMGNIYAVGEFEESAPFTVMTTAGPVTITLNGERDIFLCKYNPDGEMLWIRTFGGTDSEHAYRIAVNANCRVAVVGYFYSDVLTFPGLDPLVNTGVSDGFIASFDENGNPLWAGSLEGDLQDGYRDLAFVNDDVIAVGSMRSDETDIGPITLTNWGFSWSHDIVIARYNPEGDVVYAVNYGGDNTDAAFGLAVNGNRAYLVGSWYSTSGATFSLPGGFTTAPNAGNADFFVTAFDVDDPTDFFWLTWGGGTESDYMYDITTDRAGGVYITGNPVSLSLPIAGWGTETFPFGSDINIVTVKYAEMDGSPEWVATGVGPGNDIAKAIEAGPCGNVYITGRYSTPMIDFDGTILTGPSSFSNIYMLGYDAAGTVVYTGNTLASGFGGWGNDITISIDNKPIFGGFYRHTLEFPPLGLFPNVTPDFGDLFIARGDVDQPTAWQQTTSATTGEASGVDVVVDNAGNVYSTGTFNGTTTFGTAPDEVTLSGAGMYVTKHSPCGKLLWAAKSTVPGIDARGITLDETHGWVHVCGDLDVSVELWHSGLSPSGESCGTTMTGTGSSYVTRYSMSDGCLIDLHTFGGDFDANSIATNREGQIYIAGEFSSFGVNRVCAIKYETDWTAVWASISDAPTGLEVNTRDIVVHDPVDGDPLVYLTGAFFNELNFGALTVTSPQILDAWVLKLTDLGPTYSNDWLTKGDANIYSQGQSITTDPSGNAYVTGSFRQSLGAAFGGPGVLGHPSGSAFVARIDAGSGGVATWANPIVSSHGVWGTGISGDKSGLYLTGYWHGGQGFDALDFAPSQGIAPVDWNGNPDPSLYNIYEARRSEE